MYVLDEIVIFVETQQREIIITLLYYYQLICKGFLPVFEISKDDSFILKKSIIHVIYKRQKKSQLISFISWLHLNVKCHFC
jgi:hypothetical protein